MELKGKLGQSSVNGLLNNSLSLSPSPLPEVMEVDSLRGKNVPLKEPIKMVIVMAMHYFQSVLEHGLPSLNLNHNTYSTLPRIHVRRESMARGTKEHFNFARAAVNVPYALFVLKITETYAQEYFENGSYIQQLFTRSSHLENPKCLNGVAVRGWHGLSRFFLFGDLNFSCECPLAKGHDSLKSSK